MDKILLHSDEQNTIVAKVDFGLKGKPENLKEGDVFEHMQYISEVEWFNVTYEGQNSIESLKRMYINADTIIKIADKIKEEREKLIFKPYFESLPF